MEEYLKGEQLVNTVDVPLEMYTEMMNDIEVMKDQVEVAYSAIIDSNSDFHEDVVVWRDLAELQ